MEGFNHYRPFSAQDTVKHKRKYHVFLSFRGPDTRKSLVDHLFQSLSAAGFHVFLDTERLEKGENIGINLKDAIEGSTVHIPVFSSAYASSVWCLRELSIIWTCKSRYRETTTIPLFYDVEPSVVRYQTGIYKDSLNDLLAKGRCSSAEMDEWKEALRNVSDLSGWSLSATANGYQGMLVKHVVTDLQRILKIDRLHVAKHPVGLSGTMKEVEKLLEMDNLTRRLTVGIWGMGGIGKTTLSKAVFNNILDPDRFQAYCFVSDIRATAKESVKGLVNLQRQILRELVHVNTEFYSVDHGITQMEDHLASRKVLVILDDVDNQTQLDALVGNFYGPGSRIIVTSRDEKVLRRGKIDKIHPMEGLSEDEGVQLFSWHAFLRARPENGYEDMALKIVNACQGVPLSLEVLGAHLYSERDMRIWKEALEKIPDKVFQSLKISYDALGDQEKQIFLDIACFFITPPFSLEFDFGSKTLEFYLGFWKELGCTTVYTSLINLQGKSLIRIDGYGSHCSFWMHDHLRDLGRQIVEDESPHDPNKRSRLWCEKDIIYVLEHKQAMPEVRGLMFTELKLHQMDNLAFMHNLKFLFCSGLRLERKIKKLPRNLRYLFLSSCRLIGGSSREYFSLPTTLGQLQFLCYLHIHDPALLELPPLPKSLVHIEVERCGRLQKLSSMYHMIKLETLHVFGCSSLAQLPELNRVQALRDLKLYDCENLEELPPLPESLVHIKVDRCGRLQKLSSMYHMIKLETLHVFGCSSLAQLPELNRVQALRKLILDDCENLEELPPLPEGLINLSTVGCYQLRITPETKENA